MRAGGCTVQQTLTAEAAGVVKHAVALARRRGHAQVTPLHVAATLLASGTASILRRACLKSHPHSTSHPLQCRALELCFNVALNRLPTTAGPLVQAQPSLSNALVAALKRAQAHQRRGCLEQQQQPLLAVKVEMEQLIISILDDPSVSRVMREAGFSSTFVKNNLEETVSVFSAVNPKMRGLTEDIAGVLSPSRLSYMPPLWHQHQHQQCSAHSSSNNNNREYRNPRLQISGAVNLMDDVRSTVEVLLRRRRRNAVIVGDCLFSSENVVREFMVRAERGDVPDVLKTVQFITPTFSSLNYSSLRLLCKDDVEQKLGELRRMVNNCVIRGGAIIYAGDLKWAVENSGEDCSNQNDSNDSKYCPVEHISVELGSILSSHADSQRLWLMATATYQTYIRCQTRQPSLETLWGLQAVPIPSGGLSLTLNHPSVTNAQLDARSSCKGGEVLVSIPQMPALKTLNSDDQDLDKLHCCSECSANFEREAQVIAGSWIHLHPNISTAPAEAYFSNSNETGKSSPNSPFWLRQCKNDNTMISRSNAAEPQVDEKLTELRTKWNLICRRKHDPQYIAQQYRPIKGHASGDGRPILIEDPGQHSLSNDRSAFNSQTSFSSVPCWSCASQENQDFAAISRPQAWSVVPPPLASTSNGTSTMPEFVNVGKPTWKTHEFWTVENGRTEQHRDIITNSNSNQLAPDSSTLLDDVKTSLALGVKSPGSCSISEQANARHHNDIEDWGRPDIMCHKSRILDVMRCTAIDVHRSGSNLHTDVPPPSRIDTRSPDSILSMGNERIGQEYTLQRLSGKFRQFDAESLKFLCKGLEERVPWQSKITTAIASTVLECRSGMTRRHFSKLNHVKGDTWLLILGPDRMGKRKIAKALAEIVFGSEDNVVTIGMAGRDDEDNSRLRRGKTHAERLREALSLNPHSVVLLEDIEQANTVFMTTIVKAMERGKLVDSQGKEVGLSDAIVLMTSSLGSKYFTSPSVKGVQLDEDKLAAIKQIGMKLMVGEEENKDHSTSTLKCGDSQQSQTLDSCNGSNSHDLPIGHVGNNNDRISSCKRKAGWDNDMLAESIGRHTLEMTKRNRRNTSTDLPQSIALDLNLSADQDDDQADQDGSTTGNSDITTQETVVQKDRESVLKDEIFSFARDQQIFSPDFFKFLDNCVVFRPFDFGKVAEGLLIMLNRSYSRATNGRGALQVDSSVLLQIVSTSWESAPKSLFEKWVEDVFEHSLAMVISLHTITPRTIVRLTAVNHHNGAKLVDAFYGNSGLPTRLEVSIV